MNDELKSYLSMIEDLRSQVITLLENLPEEALNWRPIESEEDHVTNSLAVMAAHIAGAEHYWAAEVVGEAPATRKRSEEFEIKASDSAELIELLNKTGQETRQVVENLSEETLMVTRQAGDRTVAVHWALLHIIDHTALHLGHMQLTLQLWQGGQAGRSPRWFERVQ